MPDELATQYPDGSEMTVSFWAKLPKTSVSQAVFAQGDCPGAADINNQIWARFQSKHQFRCTAEKGKLKANTVTSTDTKFDDGTWHNIAIVYSRTSKPERKLEIFLDGWITEYGPPLAEPPGNLTDLPLPSVTASS